ncbi:uncharacterized protein LOC143883151 [Tasmannia lanceolata]|uniref:uncharacterized protein LOC143883151 n=1 Tax=Tasmannia lanceolata TaxID=3420 RepID=UPI0040627F9B
MEGQLLINNSSAHILIDSGSTLSFISPVFVRELVFTLVSLLNPLRVVTPLGDVVVTKLVCKECIIKIGDRELARDLLLLDMNDFKVILSREKRPRKIKMIAALQAQKLSNKGCEGYLAYLTKEDKEELSAADIHVVNQFLDVFLKDLTELPPHREVDFIIDLEPEACLFLKHHTGWPRQS